MNTQRLTLITAGIVALAVIAVIVVSRLQGPATPAPTAAASRDLDLSGQPTLGDPDAPVQLVVFEDFKCPFCRQFEENILPQLERDYIDTGKAKLTFVNFHFIGPDSTTAALASECAYAQNPSAFWEYKTVVYRAQGPESQQWATPARLEELASNVGDLDAAALRECIDAKTYQAEVDADNEMARGAGIQSTPTLLVDGSAVASALNYDTVKTAIDQALAD